MTSSAFETYRRASSIGFSASMISAFREFRYDFVSRTRNTRIQRGTAVNDGGCILEARITHFFHLVAVIAHNKVHNIVSTYNKSQQFPVALACRLLVLFYRWPSLALAHLQRRVQSDKTAVP